VPEKDPIACLPEIHAVLFDMDGTLIDSEQRYVDAMAKDLAVKGHTVSDEDVVEIVYGKAWQTIFQDLQRRGICEYDSPEDLSSTHEELIEGVAPTIHASVGLLKSCAEKVPVAVVSGSTHDHIVEEMERIGVMQELRLVLGSEDYAEGKPSPQPYLMAAELLGVSPENCLVVEDSTAGVVSARGAGMTCIAINHAHLAQDHSLADYVVDSVAELDVDAWLSCPAG